MGPGEHPVDWLSSHPFVCDPNDVAAGLGGQYPAYKEWLGSRTSRQLIPSPIIIGNDVWIGLGVTILKGVTVGDGAILAAGSVVTKKVAPYSIVGGVAAKHIRYRFDTATIERLLRVRWWDYDLRPLTALIDYSNVAAALDMIENSIAAGSIRRLELPHFEVTSRGAKRKI